MVDSMLHILPGAEGIAPPEHFTYPHAYTPHPLAVLAARDLRERIEQHPEWMAEIREGKMLGVLVVEKEGTLYYLSAFSGTLCGQTTQDGFVAPIFDVPASQYYAEQNARIVELNQQIADEEARIAYVPRTKMPPHLAEMHTLRRTLSNQLQAWLFAQYDVRNARGGHTSIDQLWTDTLPPSGAGECCAPKLLQAAYEQHLRPICMAEFWLGQNWPTGFTPCPSVGTDFPFFAACRKKCKPLLRYMLDGLSVAPNPQEAVEARLASEIDVLYEDADIAVVNKPSGLLSMAGHDDTPNLQDLLPRIFTDAEMPLVAHRLDQDTSGLIIVSKHMTAYRKLQAQFIERKVHKTYIAILERPLATQSGTIDLPIRPDLEHRPWQIVDHEHGKAAHTEWHVAPTEWQIAEGGNEGQRVILHPLTGRTHQLRVHMAYGLNNPIKGDRLYGTAADRLYLHAAEIEFVHPTSGKHMKITAPCPF